jgi:hypothetical protein
LATQERICLGSKDIDVDDIWEVQDVAELALTGVIVAQGSVVHEDHVPCRGGPLAEPSSC